MKILVKAKAGARVEKVERVDQPTLNFDNKEEGMPLYRVWVKEPAKEGKANKAIIRALAKHFDVAPSLVTLMTGQTSKQKVFSIDK